MQTVANLNQDNTDVVAHGEQQLLEVLSLRRGLFAKDTTTDLGESIDNLGNLRPKHILDILCGVVGIFHHIMEQGRTDTGRTQTHFLAGYLGYRNGVHDIRLARQSAHTFVSLSGKVECLGDEINLLAVA